MLKFLSLLLTAGMLVAAPALAADHQIKLLDQGETGAMVFEPAFVQAAPGDTITFLAVDEYHNAETIEGMLPEGAEAFSGPYSEDFTVTLTAEGVYGIRCAPHYPMGMVALIQVGSPTNLDAAKAAENPPEAQARFDGLFAQVK